MALPSPTVYVAGPGFVGADQLNTFVQNVLNVAELRTFPGLTDMTILLLGTSTPDDGGQGFYYYDATSTAIDNGTTVIRPTGLTVGAWLLLPSPVGGNAAAIGLFTNASSLAIPVGYDRVRTSGYGQVGYGGADYCYFATVTPTTVAANPQTQFYNTTTARGYALALDQNINPMMFGAVPAVGHQGQTGSTAPDSGVALNRFFAFASNNKCEGAELKGAYYTSIPLVADTSANSGFTDPEMGYTTNWYWDGSIQVVQGGAMDHILTLKGFFACSFKGLLHLKGSDFGHSEPFNTRLVANGLFIDKCGETAFGDLFIENTIFSGVETEYLGGSNNDGCSFGHITSKRVGSAPRSNDAGAGLLTTLSNRVDTGAANSFNQQSTFNATVLPPVYYDTDGGYGVFSGGVCTNPGQPVNRRMCYLLINGYIYAVQYYNRAAGTITVSPWVDSSIVNGTVFTTGYFFGWTVYLKGTDANIISTNYISAIRGGGALGLYCLYGGNHAHLDNEATGIGLLINNGGPTGTMLGLKVGRLYSEGVTCEMFLAFASGTCMQIDSPNPVNFATWQNGIDVRNGGLVLSTGGMPGLTVGTDRGYITMDSVKHDPSFTTLDFNQENTNAANYYNTVSSGGFNFTMVAMNPQITRLFGKTGGRVTCSSSVSTGAPGNIVITPSAGTTVNGSSTLTISGLTAPTDVIFNYNVASTDWKVHTK